VSILSLGLRAACVAMLFALPAADAQTVGCLFSSADGSAKAEGCSDDPRRLQTEPKIAEAIHAMGLQGQPIRFEGCERTSFATIQRPDARALVFVIRYPILAGEPAPRLLAPIVHELAHIVQIRQSGSIARLQSELRESRRIELGADFLAGVVFANHLNAQNLLYQNSLELVGRYREETFQAHGTTSQRNAAYRRGAHYRLDHPDAAIDLPRLHVEFQENDYVAAVR
jgi:hypothetical protein